jgi:hypothetical protein
MAHVLWIVGAVACAYVNFFFAYVDERRNAVNFLTHLMKGCGWMMLGTASAEVFAMVQEWAT